MFRALAIRPIPPLAGVTILAMVIALTGCPPGDPASPGPPPHEEPVPEVVDPVPPPQPENVIVVTLADHSISMPSTASAGRKTFQISNQGDVAHSFAIEGGGTEARLEADLAPGESRMLPVNLEPGTYRAFCPIGDHAERGMEAELTVEEASPRQPERD